LEQHLQVIARQTAEVRELSLELSQLFKVQERDVRSIDRVEVLHSYSQILPRLRTLNNECRKQLLVFSGLPTGKRTPGGEEADDVTMRTLHRVKEVRAIYEYVAGITKEQKIYLEKWHKAGENSRFVPKLPARMMVFDGKYAVVVVQNQSKDESATTPVICLIMANRALAQTFQSLFETFWEGAIPFDEFMVNFDDYVSRSTALEEPES
jgi:hypothetical protein